MIGLHMLNHNIIGLFVPEQLFYVCKPFGGKMLIDRIHNRCFFVGYYI